MMQKSLLFVFLLFPIVIFAYKPEDLKKLKLTKKCLKCDLSHADLRNTNFENSVLESANFKGAILTNSSFKSAYLNKADFSYANLKGVNFDFVVTVGVVPKHVKFAQNGKTFTNLSSC